MTDTQVRTDDASRSSSCGCSRDWTRGCRSTRPWPAFPAEAINAFPPNVSYTPWHLLEHLRITQWDILDYIVNRAYVERRWPEEYWPARDATATPERVRAPPSTASEPTARRSARSWPTRRPTSLAVIPNTPGHTILREVRVVGDHNSYHIGEFAILRQVMGSWPRIGRRRFAGGGRRSPRRA